MKIANPLKTLGGAIGLSALLAGAALAQSSNESFGPPVRHIASGTLVKVKLLQNLSSESANVGDSVRAQVAGDDTSGLPIGTVFVGRVTAVNSATAKHPGHVSVVFGTRPLAEGSQPPVDMASAHLKGSVARSEKAGDTSIGAGAGGLLGFSRKHKLGDALAGAALGALGGYAVDQSQKRSASDVSIKKGSEIPIRLDRSLTLRTEINAY